MHVAVIGPADPREFAADLGRDPDGLPVGLGGSTVNQLVRTLLDLGHRVTLVTASPDVREPWRGSGAGLTVVAVRYRTRARDRFLDLFRAGLGVAPPAATLLLAVGFYGLAAWRAVPAARGLALASLAVAA